MKTRIVLLVVNILLCAFSVTMYFMVKHEGRKTDKLIEGYKANLEDTKVRIAENQAIIDDNERQIQRHWDKLNSFEQARHNKAFEELRDSGLATAYGLAALAPAAWVLWLAPEKPKLRPEIDLDAEIERVIEDREFRATARKYPPGTVFTRRNGKWVPAFGSDMMYGPLRP